MCTFTIISHTFNFTCLIFSSFCSIIDRATEPTGRHHPIPVVEVLVTGMARAAATTIVPQVIQQSLISNRCDRIAEGEEATDDLQQAIAEADLKCSQCDRIGLRHLVKMKKIKISIK